MKEMHLQCVHGITEIYGVQVNIPRKQLVLSEQATMVEQLAASLQTGDVVEGVVIRTTDFGAFVSLRSPDGNLHGAQVRAQSFFTWSAACRRLCTHSLIVQCAAGIDSHIRAILG